MYVSYYYVIGHSCSRMHRPRPSTVQTGNRWVDTQWTRSRQRADRERAMGELALNEQQTCGESIASIQPTTDWRRSRYEKCRSSPDDGMQRAISFTKGKHDLRQWTDTYCMFTNWLPSLTQSGPSKQKYAALSDIAIYNKNWRRHRLLGRLFLFVSNVVWVDKFKEIKISFATCTVDLVGQVHLTSKLTISITVIRGARKIIIFLFPTFVWAEA